MIGGDVARSSNVSWSSEFHSPIFKYKNICHIQEKLRGPGLLTKSIGISDSAAKNDLCFLRCEDERFVEDRSRIFIQIGYLSKNPELELS